TTPLSDSSPSLIPFEISDSLLEEFADELALLDLIPPGKEDNNFDLKPILEKLNFLLHQDPSAESNIETIDPILKKFTNKPSLDYFPPPGDDDDDDNDDDDLFDLKSDNDEWKKLLYGDCYKDINSKKDKNKESKMKLLIVEDHIVELNDILPRLLYNDSNLPEESSKIASLSSSPFGNEHKALLILEKRNFLSISSDKELMFFLELTVIETLLSFSSENKDNVFNPWILISNRVHSFILRLSHRTYETFKIINIHPNIFNEEIPYGEIKVHIEALSVLWGNRLLIWTVLGCCLGAYGTEMLNFSLKIVGFKGLHGVNTAQLVLLVYKVDVVINKVNAAKTRVTTAVRVSTAGWIK
nr:hypothetical protein [Tanacetum cinerariifolium]